MEVYLYVFPAVFVFYKKNMLLLSSLSYIIIDSAGRWIVGQWVGGYVVGGRLVDGSVVRGLNKTQDKTF